ncbi:MAG: bifunctional hydroxymethylpyrimidine kinase/phosphomethylpyrimidine kinase, partial [Longimicrobiales bacterium]
TAELVRGVAAAIERAGLRHYVLDPVMVATSGDRLLDEGAVDDVLERLLPLATVVTPNLDEAALLTGIAADGEASLPALAEALVAAGARSALVKGGHLEGDRVVDVWFDGARFERWERPRVRTRSTHGTGCTLSAAIAAGLAWGRPLPDSIEDALAFVHRALASAPGLGGGHGPLNHFVEARSAVREAAPGPDA